MNHEMKMKKLKRIADWVFVFEYTIMFTLFLIICYMNTLPSVSHASSAMNVIIIDPEPIIEEVVVEQNPIKPEVEIFNETIKETIKENISSEVSIGDEIIEEPEYRMEIDDKTLEVLIRVVEAEVTGDSYRYKGEDLTYEELLYSKVRVAQVFMNRVEDNDSFARITSLYKSLTEENASATFKDGRYYEVEITDITRKAVELALLADTPDYTDGALYFSSGTTKCKYGSLLFVDSVGHAFFK